MKKKDSPLAQRLSQVIAGRTVDEQIQDIREHGNHGVPSLLRTRVLGFAGIPQPKEKAENLIVFGCYVPFMVPLLLRDYLRILDCLGLEYTHLEKEFCCGLPMIEPTAGAENEKAVAAGKEFVQMNRDLAQQKGAKTMSYCCVWCAHLAKRFFPDDTIRHLYYPDLIIEKLENATLKVAPTVIGYYEGCHRRNRVFAPGINLDWGNYRRLLDRIEGLKVVDLPNRICCMDFPQRIVEEAEKKSVDAILCSCNSCYARVGAAAKGKVPMKYFPEVLLQALIGV